MAKFYGKIGYAMTAETSPGVWTDQITERFYSGDLVRNTTSRWTTSENVNDDLEITNSISILADPFAYQHFHCMKYIEFAGSLWKITSVEVVRPRLILTLGGLYNGK